MNTANQPEFADMLSHRRTVVPGDIVFLEGQEAEAAYIVLKGEAQVTLTDSSGKQLVINRIYPGQMFGELELLGTKTKRTATVMSQEGCELLVVDKAVVDQRVAAADPFLRFMFQHLCNIITGWTDLAKKT